MRGLLFTSRVAFICNLFFVLCLLMRYTHIYIPEAAKGFIVLVGWILSVIINVVLHAWIGLTRIQKKSSGIPLWLKAFNLFWFFFQIVYFILTT